ncbi:hypothetical protein [Actinomycetospora aeridis]|uniref:Uncharacterized protein n=1 Tax=Actinomycetospora aeridis TaxID=3129231 RepID=A0ABU8NDG3_9PSEU
MTNYATIMLICTMYAARRKRTYTFRFEMFRRPLPAIGVTALAVIGGAIVGVPSALLNGLFFGATFGLSAIVFVVLRFAAAPANTAASLGPNTYLRDDTRVSLALGIVVGSYFALYYYPIYGLYIASVFGTMILLAVPMTSMYVRYLAAVHLGAKKFGLPLRFTLFLNDCARAGFLRVSGGAFEFKHREVQDYLASRAEADSIATRGRAIKEEDLQITA